VIANVASVFGTHVGLVRDHNEDSYLSRPDIGLWAIADGMGGHLGGEVASRIVIDELAKRVELGESLVDAVAATHYAVLHAVETGLGQPGMGATVVCVALNESNYQVAWVGDSRAYLVSKHGIRQLTRDHSFVQQLLDAGAITEAEAPLHPDRSIVTQAIGSDSLVEVKVDTFNGRLHKGDQILLCSDGLSSEVSEPTITKLLLAPNDQTTKIQSLIEASLKAGGSDNVTVVLIDAPEDALDPPRPGSTVPIDANRLNILLVEHETQKSRHKIIDIFVGIVLVALLLTIYIYQEQITGFVGNQGASENTILRK
jgi:protein phosphatase